MRSILLVIISLLIIQHSFAAFSIPEAAETPVIESKEQVTKSQIDAIRNLSAKDFERVTGKKLNVIQRLIFKIEKKRLVDRLEKDDTSRKFNWIGFALGLLYGPIGLLAVYIFSTNTAARSSAWLGFKIWLLILGVFLLVLLAVAGGRFK